LRNAGESVRKDCAGVIDRSVSAGHMGWASGRAHLRGVSTGPAERLTRGQRLIQNFDVTVHELSDNCLDGRLSTVVTTMRTELLMGRFRCLKYSVSRPFGTYSSDARACRRAAGIGG
jgi:hypothetical protein